MKDQRKHKRLCQVLLMAALVCTVSCQSTATTPSASTEPLSSLALPEASAPSFKDWMEHLKQEAVAQGISAKSRAELDRITPDTRAIRLDRKQPEAKKSFATYKKTILNPKRIAKARAFYHQHRALLEKVGKHYGVQPRFIVALLSIETNIGEIMGNFDAMNALATLSYEGRRRELFTRELMAALRMLDTAKLTRADLRGSWAGAMGQCQFMPTSYLKYAVDYDRDGTADIWRSTPDVVASVARYLSAVGWNANVGWGRKVSYASALGQPDKGLKIEKTLQEWQALGVRNENETNLPDISLRASLIIPDDQSGEAYLVYSNYKTLMDWNRSLYFATTVGLLADAIVQ